MKNKKLRIVSKIINALSILVLIYLIYRLYVSNLVPTKYFILICVVLGVLEVIYTFFCYKKTKKGILIFFDIMAVIFIASELFGTFKLNETINFFKKNLNIEYTVDTYYVVVNKEASYKKIKDIEGKNIYYYDETINKDKLNTEVKKKVSAKLTKEKDYSTLLDTILKDKEYIIILHSSNYESITDMDENYKNNTRELAKIEIKTRLEKKKQKKNTINLLEKPFTLYLSGIDTRSNYMPARSLSDVNMVVAVNPKTHKVLLVSTPRDYYVQLHGTTGLKDKLTHAGMIGGVDLSKATIEDIYGIKIDNYARVNFNAVINLVDAVGGITLNSDVNYSFSCWTDRSCIFKPGNNNVGGKCALAFARERHAYQTGDRHRGENQQQVIKVLLNKLTSPGSVLSNYSNILKALEGTFETSLTMDDITSLIKYQLDKMPSWNVESISVDGKGTMKETHSYPTRPLSVMIPDEETIKTAKQKITEVMTEK